jgi:glycosyltransferase involved in cell wall biosynthesis
VIFQNADDLQEFRERGLIELPIAHIVNGSGVELQHFTPVSLPGNATFLLIARLLADKGIREYVEAASQIRRSYPHARFLLVGWYDDNPDSLRQEEVDDWISQGTVEFLGRLEDVRPAIAQADVYVLPSYREGAPRTVLEAMAMGRPIITTDVPGCREMVVEGVNGFLVPPRDANAIAQAIRRFLEDPRLAARMGHESRRMVEARFDSEIVAMAVVNAAGL